MSEWTEKPLGTLCSIKTGKKDVNEGSPNGAYPYVRPMRRKWASCSTAGTLSFNDELLGMDTKLGDYVIVHELLHFSIPNHGKLWKSLMRAHLGDWEELEKRLPRVFEQKVK